MNKFRKPHGDGGRNVGRFGEQGLSRPSFDRPARPQFGGRRPEGPELFDAVCSKCGNACQVPFRPNGRKPVYCRACFGSPSQASSNRESFIRRDVPVSFFEPRNENREIADLKQRVDAMNSKIDSILRILEAMPRAAAPAAVVVPPVLPKPDLQGIVRKDLPKKKVAKKKGVAKK